MTERFDFPQGQPIAQHLDAPLVAWRDDVCFLTLKRPSEHNRLDPADIDAMQLLFDGDLLDREARALVITGSGDKTFSSGFTLHAIAKQLDERFERLLDTLENLPMVTIVVFNGSVYGGATDLALCCDVRLGIENMKMFMPAARFGLHYYPGGIRRYVTRLGLSAASRLMLTGTAIDSQDMLQIGFLSERLSTNKIGSRLQRYLDDIARTEKQVVASMKRDMLEMARPQGTHDGESLNKRMRESYEKSMGSAELHRRLKQLLDK